MVFPSEQFEPEKSLIAVSKEKCTGIYGVPTMFNAEVHHDNFASYDVSSLRTGVMAGSPCPVELMKLVTTKMHCGEMTIGYGLTEASPIITQPMSPSQSMSAFARSARNCPVSRYGWSIP